jgi:copper chaperone CopZ
MNRIESPVPCNVEPFQKGNPMKNLIAGCLLAAGLATSAYAGEKTETIKVSGWHCGGCAARTESALKDVKGVQSVTSDKEKKEVVVKYDDTKAKHADLEKAIANSGFAVAKD